MLLLLVLLLLQCAASCGSCCKEQLAVGGASDSGGGGGALLPSSAASLCSAHLTDTARWRGFRCASAHSWPDLRCWRWFWWVLSDPHNVLAAGTWFCHRGLRGAASPRGALKPLSSRIAHVATSRSCFGAQHVCAQHHCEVAPPQRGCGGVRRRGSSCSRWRRSWCTL